MIPVNEEEDKFSITDQSDPKEPENSTQTCLTKTTKANLLKNLAVLSIGFTLIYSGLGTLVNLQSSLNTEAGLGTTCLAIAYVSLIVSCLLVPPFLISCLGLKWTLVVSMTSFVVYVAANFYPTWYTLLPASILLGASGAPIWSAKCALVKAIATEYALINNENVKSVISRFFGIFFAFCQSCYVWGNLTSSLILQRYDDNNTDLLVDIENSTCGIHFCSKSTANLTTVASPEEHRVVLLIGLCATSSIVAVLLVAIFVDNITMVPINRLTDNKLTSLNLLFSTFRQMKDPKQLMIIPLTVYSGVQLSYLIGDFTIAFVSCYFGIGMIGYVMLCFGVTNVLYSVCVGKLMEKTDARLVMTLGFMFQTMVMAIFVFWKPFPTGHLILFVTAAFWGLGDATWQTGVNAIYATTFLKAPDAAFSNYRLWMAVGSGIAYAYSSQLCVLVKTYICFCFLVFGIVCYFCIYLLPNDEATINQVSDEDSVKL